MIRAIIIIALIVFASARPESQEQAPEAPMEVPVEVEISAACRGGTLNVCKQKGRINCLSVVSQNTCINLIGGPFVSGFTGGNYQCTVFKNRGCGGSTNFVNSFGGDFTFTAASLRCPCT
jgi:hypothetical protein